VAVVVLSDLSTEQGGDFSGWAFPAGSADDIRSVTGQYAVYVERMPDGLAHSDAILLIDRHGQLRSAFGLQADPQTILEKARQLARE
jgi:cytochrome oxidase Cu insertion factor (SCO1/SenC/PrrC family)